MKHVAPTLALFLRSQASKAASAFNGCGRTEYKPCASAAAARTLFEKALAGDSGAVGHKPEATVFP
ncbi:MAG: hypothetical protein IKA05_01075 [Clostridia bacterium]|nr:hypothetical protein [Clostridia bacterium]